MNIDLTCVPFSRFGSYLAISMVPEGPGRPAGLYLRSIHGGARRPELLRIEMIRNGKAVDYRLQATPSQVALAGDAGRVRFCLHRPEELRIRGEGAGLRLSMPRPVSGDFALPGPGGRWQIDSTSSRTKLMLTALRGRLEMDAPWKTTHCQHIVAELVPDGEGILEAGAEEFSSGWCGRPLETAFDECVRAVQHEYEKFVSSVPATPRSYAGSRELAGYVNWSSVVAPRGALRRHTMLMSKNGSTSCWGWDHCFNALALARKQPALAWDQMMTVFDQQDADGCLPHAVNDAGAADQFAKPPIHGWTLQRLMQQTDFVDPDRLEELYEPLSAWTDWWLTFRDYDADGIPQYNHGSDSGWDNATIFDEGCPVESPDLTALLVYQMHVLAEVAQRLQRGRDQKLWQMRAYELFARLMDHSWRGDRFAALCNDSHTEPAPGDSLLPYMPILLGEKLPRKVRKALVGGLRTSGRFFTSHGMATESPRSSRYETDGQWRGPIWAPATYLLCDGLRRSGQQGLAGEIARRFCKMCRQSGFAANFDAETGQPVRAGAHAWTASVFLLLANEFLVKK
ncbi:MAG: amylo-alpha-1,6-glucosidase [Planctomycetota bacterium]